MQEIIDTVNEAGLAVNDIVIDFDDLGRCIYMQNLVVRDLLKVYGQGQINADTPMAPVHIASGK